MHCCPLVAGDQKPHVVAGDELLRWRQQQQQQQVEQRIIATANGD